MEWSNEFEWDVLGNNLFEYNSDKEHLVMTGEGARFD